MSTAKQWRPRSLVPAAFRHRLQFLAHLITALVIILEGLSRSDHFAENGPFVAILLASGAAVLVITLAHNLLEHAFRHFQALLYALEALVLLVIAVLYVREDKVAVQYPFFACSYLYAGMVGYSLRRLSNPNDSALHEKK